jgi:hypothetical protein
LARHCGADSRYDVGLTAWKSGSRSSDPTELYRC